MPSRLLWRIPFLVPSGGQLVFKAQIALILSAAILYKLGGVALCPHTLERAQRSARERLSQTAAQDVVMPTLM